MRHLRMYLDECVSMNVRRYAWIYACIFVLMGPQSRGRVITHRNVAQTIRVSFP